MEFGHDILKQLDLIFRVLNWGGCCECCQRGRVDTQSRQFMVTNSVNKTWHLSTKSFPRFKQGKFRVCGNICRNGPFLILGIFGWRVFVGTCVFISCLFIRPFIVNTIIQFIRKICQTCRMAITWHYFEWYYIWAILTSIFIFVKHIIIIRYARQSLIRQLNRGFLLIHRTCRILVTWHYLTSLCSLRTLFVLDGLIDMLARLGFCADSLHLQGSCNRIDYEWYRIWTKLTFILILIEDIICVWWIQ